MARKANVTYDAENDILWASTGEKVKESLEIDSFILDLSQADAVIGVEILDASKVLAKMLSRPMGKETLASIQSASISLYQGKELSFVVLKLSFPTPAGPEELPVQIPAPRAALA